MGKVTFLNIYQDYRSLNCYQTYDTGIHYRLLLDEEAEGIATQPLSGTIYDKAWLYIASVSAGVSMATMAPRL